jgi:hypothetical protein
MRWNIIRTFENSKECFEGDWRSELPGKTGMSFLRQCYKEGKEFYGFKIVDEKDLQN